MDYGSWIRVLGFKIKGFRFRVHGFGFFLFKGLWFRDYKVSLGFRVHYLGCLN
jgi:hypothetical protein